MVRTGPSRSCGFISFVVLKKLIITERTGENRGSMRSTRDFRVFFVVDVQTPMTSRPKRYVWNHIALDCIRCQQWVASWFYHFLSAFLAHPPYSVFVPPLLLGAKGQHLHEGVGGEPPQGREGIPVVCLQADEEPLWWDECFLTSRMCVQLCLPAEDNGCSCFSCVFASSFC